MNKMFASMLNTLFLAVGIGSVLAGLPLISILCLLALSLDDMGSQASRIARACTRRPGT